MAGPAKVSKLSKLATCNRVSARGLLGEGESKRLCWSGDIMSEADRQVEKREEEQETRKAREKRRDRRGARGKRRKKRQSEQAVPSRHF